MTAFDTGNETPDIVGVLVSIAAFDNVKLWALLNLASSSSCIVSGAGELSTFLYLLKPAKLISPCNIYYEAYKRTLLQNTFVQNLTSEVP